MLECSVSNPPRTTLWDIQHQRVPRAQGSRRLVPGEQISHLLGRSAVQSFVCKCQNVKSVQCQVSFKVLKEIR